MFLSVPSFAVGFATGFGTGVIGREMMRWSNAAMRPVAKAVIKGGMVAYDKTREAFAMTGETFEDLVAEARADIHAAPVGSEKAGISPEEETVSTGGRGATTSQAAVSAGHA